MNKKLLEISEKLISFDTTSNLSNLQCTSYLANVLEDKKFTVHLEQEEIHGVKKTQLVAWAGKEGPKGLMLSGHLDTVPYKGQPGWTKDPLKLKIENDRVFGRGSCDMKLFIAQCASLNLDLKKLQAPLVFYFTCDEEIGCQGAQRLGPRLQSLLPFLPPKRCVIGEPTGFKIISAHKGIAQLKIIIKGVGGHSSRPYLGKNALLPLQELIGIIEKLNRKFEQENTEKWKMKFPDFPYNYLHLAQIHGGLASNMIPDSCEVTCSWRIFPGESADVVLNELNFLIAQSNLKSDLEIKDLHVVSSMREAQDPQLLEILQSLSHDQHTHAAHYATDGGPLSHLGMDCFVWGPGDVDQAHCPDEFMPLKDFTEGPKLIEQLIAKCLTT